MHEMALMGGLLRILEDQARTRRFSRVKTVWLEIGALSSVEPEAIRWCFEVARRETLADGAALVIEQPPGRALCLDCAREVAISRRGDPCPDCGGFRLHVTGGQEMRVRELEVE